MSSVRDWDELLLQKEAIMITGYVRNINYKYKRGFKWLYDEPFFFTLTILAILLLHLSFQKAYI